MAVRALPIRVAVGQQETRAAVIEGDEIPAHGALVAVVAICGCECRTSLRVGRIVSRLPSGEMAARGAASCRGNLQIVIIVDMASRAGQVGVAIRELKTGGAVIEFGTEPAVKRMAARALTGSERWTGTGVRRIGGVLPVFEVARIALRGEAQELTDRGALVA